MEGWREKNKILMRHENQNTIFKIRCFQGNPNRLLFSSANIFRQLGVKSLPRNLKNKITTKKLGLSFSGGGGSAPIPPKHSGPPQAENFWDESFCSLQRMCFFYNLFGLVTSETVERVQRREVPFSKHFAAVFFENLFLQIF